MTKSSPTRSSRFIYAWFIGGIALMFCFMLLGKRMTGGNTKAERGREFAALTAALHQQTFADALGGESSIAGALRPFTGHQISLKDSEIEVLSADLSKLGGKPLAVIRVNAPSVGEVAFAIYPMAKRNFPKTFMFAGGSFLWLAYRVEGERALVIPKGGGDTAPYEPGAASLIAANYMNDYFIMAAGKASHQALAQVLDQAFYLYNPAVVRTLSPKPAL